MNQYSELAAEVKEMLAKDGQQMTIRRKIVNSSDPASGAVDISSSDYQVHGILTNYSDRMVSDDLVKRGDRKALIEAVTVTPIAGDTLIVGGKEWSVIDFQAIDPAGIPVLFKLQVRS